MRLRGAGRIRGMVSVDRRQGLGENMAGGPSAANLTMVLESEESPG